MKCRQRDPRIAFHISLKGNIVRGPARCMRPPDHDRCHKGQGIIWNDKNSRYTTNTRKTANL